MKLFPLKRHIKSKEGVTHFKRYLLFPFGKYGNLYLHIIYQPDKDEHLHNHPWNYVQIPIYGKYIEKLEGDEYHLVKPLQMNKRNGLKIFHKIEKLLSKKVITLFFVGKRYNDNWGYNVDGEFVDNRTYRFNKNINNSK